MAADLTPYYTRIRNSSHQRKGSLTPYYTRIRTAAEKVETAPNIGQVSELIRNTITKEYDIYPPNLSTAIQQDQTIVITAVNPDTGLNLQVTLKNLAGNLISPVGNSTGVVPMGGPETPTGATPETGPGV